MIGAMVLLIGATLAVASIAILVYPFLKARLRPRPEARLRPRPEDSPAMRHRGGNTPRLEAIYQEISTLRLEYQLGKVPEDVYRELLRVYRVEAAVALREQAQAGEPVPGDELPKPSPAKEDGISG